MCTASYFLLNTSDLTLPVIGSNEPLFIPPVIILQSWKIVPFTADHIWSLYKAVHTQNLGILHHLVSLETLSLLMTW